jgi:hypothetical protein
MILLLTRIQAASANQVSTGVKVAKEFLQECMGGKEIIQEQDIRWYRISP